MATKLRVFPPNEEFSFHVLKHIVDRGVARYTIGTWDGATLRAICHVRSLSGALLSITRELDSPGRDDPPTVTYPRWSEICELVHRLSNRADTDCMAAAGYLEELHARLHNATADLEVAVQRLTKLGNLIEEAATQSRVLEEPESECKAIGIPQAAWFRLLALYRDKQEGSEAYRELQILREIAGITAETLRTVDDWLGHASTREAAMEALWRLRRILEAAGYKMPLEHLEWRGQIIRAMEDAGVGLGDDGVVRLRQPADKYWAPATGVPIKELLQNAVQHTT